MLRRNFLRVLGITVAAVAVAPKMILDFSKKLSREELKRQAFREWRIKLEQQIYFGRA